MDSTYSPHSPDLSSFLSSSPKAQQVNNSTMSRQPYTPRSPTLPFLGTRNLDKNSFDYVSNSFTSNFNPSPTSNFESSSALYAADARQQPLSTTGSTFTDIKNLSHIPQRNLRALIPAQASSITEIHPESQDYHKNHRINATKSEFSSNDCKNLAFSNTSNARYSMSSICSSKDSTEHKNSVSSISTSHFTDPNPQKIEIKTKFPVARIKRIMQADEEVGKVAQVTPVAVSKALELFMIALVMGAADKAREKGSKKVNAQHLKSVVDSQPERFDFLAEIVGRVGRGSEGGSNESNKANRKQRKEETESESEEEREKSKKRGRGRKKKIED